MESLKEANLEGVHVIMGGRLNEPIDGSDLPVDVSHMLKEMGINTDNNVETIVDVIASFNR